MVLVATTGVAIFLARIYCQTMGAISEWWQFDPSLTGMLGSLFRLVCILQPINIALASSLLILRSMRPRPRLTRMMRQPGTVACFAIVFVALFRIVQLAAGMALACISGNDWRDLTLRMSEGTLPIGSLLDDFWLIAFTQTDELVPHMCLAVGVSWAVVRLGGCCHPESTWIDRTGRILGAYYILLVPLLFYLFPFPYTPR